MEKEPSKRQEERLESCDSAVVTLADGQTFQGGISDMSMGGMLFVAEEGLPQITQGEQVALRFELYGQLSTFFCVVTHQKGQRVGLKLLRK